MLKKILILLITLFMSITTSFAVEDTDIIGAAAIYIRLGMMPQNSLWEAFDNKAAFVQWDCQTPKNKIAIYDFDSSDAIAKFNGKVTSRLYNFYYQGDYLEQLPLNHKPPVALYKLIGDTIYQYDNKLNKKQGILGTLGFYEDGPGNLVAYAKISPDGILTKFDPSGNKIVSFEAESNTRIAIFDANHKKIGYYNLLTIEQILPKADTIQPVGSFSINSNRLLPTLMLLAKSNKLKNENWLNSLKNSDYAIYYNSDGIQTTTIEQFGSDMYLYDRQNRNIGHFSPLGSDIYIYDNQNRNIGHFSTLGSDVYLYDKNNQNLGYYSFLGSNIYFYNKRNQITESYSILGSTIYQYDANGKQVGEYSLL